ncbi:MaoC/PaaZ C-terminal domain-containing protein [Mesorhizobium sp. B2-4-6]|uniref:MaoC family dehydratase n=1 Tax=Mesorhizobium sp. B2-4-6 TaxID=2589943 RepID=UPI00112CE6FA|nr:MaoC/PaaZ C-terminal domain-containing protein [Mesorhizobium sp. B2-4-6]TPL54020.1 dihydroxy-acid dehydratase [Mesorhizobium sp. B2-4-6]
MTLRPREPVVYGPLTRSDLVRYAGASGDFNPLHHDHEFAAKAGLPDVMAHGMLSAGMLASALTKWFGPGSVRRYAVRFHSPVWPGDLLTAHCRSIDVLAGGSGGQTADLVVELQRGDGDVVLSGTARVLTGNIVGDAPRARSEQARTAGEENQEGT